MEHTHTHTQTQTPSVPCAAVASSALEFTGLSLHHNDSQGESPEMQPTDEPEAERTSDAMPTLQLSATVASADGGAASHPAALPSPPPLMTFTHTASAMRMQQSAAATATAPLAMSAAAVGSDSQMESALSPDGADSDNDQTATSLLQAQSASAEAAAGLRMPSTVVGDQDAAAAAAATAGAGASLEPHAAPPRKQQRGRRMRGRPMHSHVAFMLKKLRAEQQRQSEIDESQPTETESSDNEQAGESGGSHRRGVSFAQTLTQQRFFLSHEQTDRLHDTATPAQADAATAAAAVVGDAMDSELAATSVDEQPQPSAAMEPPSESDAMEDEESESARTFSSLRGSPSLPRNVSPPPADFGTSDASSPPVAPLLKSILKRRRNDDDAGAAMDAAATATAAPPGRSLPDHAKRQRRGHHAVACALGNAQDAAASAAALQQQASDAALSACTSLAGSGMSPMLQQLLYGDSARNDTLLASRQPRNDGGDRCDAAMDESGGGGGPPQQQSQPHAQSPTEPLRHFAPPPLPPFAEDAHMALMHSPTAGAAAANCDPQPQQRAASVSPYFSHAAAGTTLQSLDERKDSTPPASSASSSHVALSLPHDWAQGWRTAAATSNPVSQCS